jgi:hypothetical protein
MRQRLGFAVLIAFLLAAGWAIQRRIFPIASARARS